VGPIPTHPDFQSLLFPYLTATILSRFERPILSVDFAHQSTCWTLDPQPLIRYALSRGKTLFSDSISKVPPFGRLMRVK
jgi:hypothetical protein